MHEDCRADEELDDRMDETMDPLLNAEYLAAAALWDEIQLHRQKAGLEPHDKRRLPPEIDPAFYRTWEFQ